MSQGDSPFAEGTATSPAGTMWPRFCLRCQSALAVTDPPRCGTCGLPFNPDDSRTWNRMRQRNAFRYWLPAFCLAVFSGVASYAICLQFGNLGSALFVAVPLSFGAILGYAARVGYIALLLLLLALVASVVLGLVMFHWVGFFCGLMLSVGFLGPALCGVLLGWVMRRVLAQTRWDQRWFLPLLFLVALPYASQALENQFPRRQHLSTVRTRLTVDATPREAWKAIMFYEEVEHAAPWLLRLALPRPLSSEGSKDRVGNIVRCRYDRGHLVKRISRRIEPRRLDFEVIEQRLHFERDVTLRDGAFEILRLGEHRSQIVLTTRYERHLSPQWLWQPVEHQVITTLHAHVLEGMRRFAASHRETPPSPSPSDAPSPPWQLASGDPQ